MFQFLTHVELSMSISAILEMSQYVAYQKIIILCVATGLSARIYLPVHGIFKQLSSKMKCFRFS